jgi:hypothetical protein
MYSYFNDLLTIYIEFVANYIFYEMVITCLWRLILIRILKTDGDI